MSENQNPPTCWPGLSYDDAPAAIDFLVDVLGFERTFVVPGDGDREVPHAELRWPEGGGVMLGSRSKSTPFADRPAGCGSTYVVTDDVDSVYARAKAAGAKIVRELEDTDYGNHEFSLADAEGNLWSFGTYRGA
jgi:uncharacterized glyoxalase superfamily protein PhnB